MRQKLISLFLLLCVSFSLAIPVGAASTNDDVGNTNSEIRISMVNNIFQNVEACDLFDPNGVNITSDFIKRHQKNFDDGNISCIVDEILEKDITVFCSNSPAVGEISPYLLVNYSATGVIYKSFVYNGTKYLATIGIKLTAKVNDSTNTFSSIDKPTVTYANAEGLSKKVEAHFSAANITTSSGSRACQIVCNLNLYCDGNFYYSKWLLTASTSSNTLKGEFKGSVYP